MTCVSNFFSEMLIMLGIMVSAAILFGRLSIVGGHSYNKPELCICRFKSLSEEDRCPRSFAFAHIRSLSIYIRHFSSDSSSLFSNYSSVGKLSIRLSTNHLIWSTCGCSLTHYMTRLSWDCTEFKSLSDKEWLPYIVPDVSGRGTSTDGDELLIFPLRVFMVT